MKNLLPAALAATTLSFAAPQAAMATPTIYDVGQIHEFYSENKPGANARYNNKFFIVKGKVDSVENEYVVVDGQRTWGGRLYCHFAPGEVSKVLNFREGDPITVQGVVQIRDVIFGARVYIDDCQVVGHW